MFYVDGDPVSYEEASELLTYSEMREEGIESFLSLVFLAKDGGVECCGHFWEYEEE